MFKSGRQFTWSWCAILYITYTHSWSVTKLASLAATRIEVYINTGDVTFTTGCEECSGSVERVFNWG